MPAIAIATPIFRAASRTPWRTLLFVTASAVALAASPPAAAQNECGALAGAPLAATCTVDLNPYADGINYAAGADFTLNLDDGVVVTRDAASPGPGVSAGGTGVVSVIAPNVAISTAADLSDGMNLLGNNGVTLDLGGTISTAGMLSEGVRTFSGLGPITITSSAAISTTGEGSHGIVALGGAPFEGEPTPTSVISTGVISVTGLNAHGIVAAAPGDVIIDAGDTSASGVGVIAAAGGAANVTVSGNVAGGAVLGLQPTPLPLIEDPTAPTPFAAGVVIAAETSATLTNNGGISSLSDTAVVAFSPLTQIDNNGTIIGYVVLGEGDSTFNNNSSTSFELRDFADTDGDGVRDTESVAISDFGAGIDTFNNNADGAVILLNVAGATAWDSSGSFSPVTVNAAFHDITIEGVEQGQFINLETFNNFGAIIMQDMLAGGASPVAGDILVITGGADGPATYVSQGGSLHLDTVFNEGGAASQSDILMADSVALGSGATSVFIENAGGLGAQTVDNGILVVDVADPVASATDAFALGNDFLIVGPWQYQLYQGGDAGAGGDPADGDWYLRSNISPTTRIYSAYPSAVMRTARTAVGTLQQRLGNRWWRVPEQRVERTVTDPPPPPPPPQTREFLVYFDWDRSEIRDDAEATIREAAEYAKSGNAARIVVIGHTDTSGSTEYNLGLSERRAQAVSSALQAEGVAAQVIGMEWLGETQPAVQTGDGVREERNRRALVQVSVPGAANPASMQPRTRTVVDVVPPSTEIQGSAGWGRIVGVASELESDDDLGGVEEETWLAQGGADFLVNEDENGRTFVGFSLHYGETTTDVNSDALGELANIDSTGWGLSGSVTWYGQNGAYFDGVLSGTWFESDIDSGLFGPIVSENEAFVWAISAEGGMRYAFEPGSKYYWVPQGQLIYTSVDVDGFTDQFGAEVDEADADSLIGRLGVAVEYLDRKTGENGETNRIQGYGAFNLLYEFLGAPGASVSGLDIDEEIDDFWGEFGAGFTYSMNDQWAFYGEASYRTALEDFGDSQAVQGSLGVRFHW